MNRKLRRAEAKPSRNTVRTMPSGAGQLLAAAVQKHQAGRHDEAERLYRQLLARVPGNADAWHLLGVITYQKGRPDLAIDLIRHAIAINPAEASYHCNLGVAFKQLGCPDDAIACYRRALQLRPQQPEAHNSLGNVLAEQGHLDAALTCYRTAIALRGDYPEAYYNLGLTLREHGELAEATDCYRRAISLRPDYHDAHYNLGNALRELRQFRAAIASYHTAIKLSPDFADTHLNAALALLASGDLPAGWAEYEWRWQTSAMEAARRDFAQPQWRGEAAEGQTLLIHAEQGFGDTLQFCRYAPLVAARGLQVHLEVQAPLVRLLRCLPGVNRVFARGEELPDFDRHCPMLSLPLAMRTTMQSIPNAVSYLSAAHDDCDKWQARLAAVAGQRLRIGLVWAGRRSNASDQRRSMALEQLAPLFALTNASFFSLQYGGHTPPAGLPLIDYMDEMVDFADTAALIAGLDLVISVDTAVAHLAAALGRPVWLLDRFDACWRWLDGRNDSPWYPALRIYRQPRPGDWPSVLAEVTRDLHAMTSCRTV